jgi:asparagine synthetase B (glutamine-hydrolysing)
MSGFLVSRGSAGAPGGRLDLLERRGPDGRHTLDIEDFRFKHYPSGDSAGDLIHGDVAVVFDGELFGRPAEQGICAYLAERYGGLGENFVRGLEGDFAIALYDFGRRILLAATDAFGTKPLFLRGQEVASYRSALGGGESLPPNTVAVVGLDDGARRDSVVEPFDFGRQHKESYDDWIAAFERAIALRAVPGCYLPLSAGYDSGGIDCALRRLGLPYKSFSIAGRENLELLRLRGRENGEILPMDDATFEGLGELLERCCEPAGFRVEIFTGEEEDYEIREDRASRGLALIHSRAREEGRKVFLSGTGVDETLAANRHWPGGLFPDPLSPWPDFDGNWQKAYLAKEELVAGAFGAEGRYPYLDRRLVQEFLWLRADLKSRRYKAPLDEYMRSHGYPFDENVKTGFNPLPVD